MSNLGSPDGPDGQGLLGAATQAGLPGNGLTWAETKKGWGPDCGPRTRLAGLWPQKEGFPFSSPAPLAYRKLGVILRSVNGRLLLQLERFVEDN